MKTFEETFGRLPTDEDYNIQIHTMEAFVDSMRDEYIDKKTIKLIVKQMRTDTK